MRPSGLDEEVRSCLASALNGSLENAASAGLPVPATPRRTLTAVSTPADASLWTLPAAPCWKSRLYTGSLLCQAISQVMTFILPSRGQRSCSRDRGKLTPGGDELKSGAGNRDTCYEPGVLTTDNAAGSSGCCSIVLMHTPRWPAGSKIRSGHIQEAANNG